MPNSNESAGAIDFTTAFGRLLRDGLLRDALAANPKVVLQQMEVRERDRSALLQLVAEDLEYQAVVLLRKRFGMVREILRQTIQRLGDDGWSVFHRYARSHWPPGGDLASTDARDFAVYLKKHRPESVCESEWNRLEFVRQQRRLALHWVRQATTGQENGRRRRMLQLLFWSGSSRQRRHELFLSFRL